MRLRPWRRLAPYRRSSAAEHRQVVLRVVDRAPGSSGAGQPSHAPVASAVSRSKRLVNRHRAVERAHHLERVERRHARPALADVEARIRQPAALARGADGEAQASALGGDAIVLDGRARAPSARRRGVEQHRILAASLREDALGEAGDEDDVEGEAAQRVGRATKTRP